MIFFIGNENYEKKYIVFTIIITKTWCGKKKQYDILTSIFIVGNKSKTAVKNATSSDQAILASSQ